MRETAIIVMPIVLAGAAVACRTDSPRRWLLPVAGVGHALLAFWLMIQPPAAVPGRWVAFDPVARAALPAVSLLFLVCSFYGAAYLSIRTERPNRVFAAGLLALLGFLSLALQAQHLGVLWVAVEAAALCTVPLLHFNGTARAIEAAWKYLLIGGTGIALSLLGSFALGYASLQSGAGGDLTFAGLAAQGAALSRPWVLVAWVLLLAGYGTKMGLAPMHTWKPDAYGEAPAIVGAILAGGVTTCAFVALLRVQHVMEAAGQGLLAGRTMLGLGLFSMLLAALFLLGTPDAKRMLAYSSVEHMGILSVGAAVGGPGIAAALFHVWSNGLTKGALFLSAGNMRRAAGSSHIASASGMARLTPVSARTFVVGVLAVTACPPFGPFFSELGVLRAGFANGYGAAMAIFLSALLLAFLGMTRLAFAMVDGRPRKESGGTRKRFRESPGVILPPLVLLGFSLWLGAATPQWLRDCWQAAMEALRFPA